MEKVEDSRAIFEDSFATVENSVNSESKIEFEFSSKFESNVRGHHEFDLNKLPKEREEVVEEKSNQQEDRDMPYV